MKAESENFVKFFRRPLSENSRGILVRVDYQNKCLPDPDPNDGNDDMQEASSTVHPQRFPDVGAQSGKFSKNAPNHNDVICPNNSARRLISGGMVPSAPKSHSHQVVERSNLNDGSHRGNNVGESVDVNNDSVDHDVKNLDGSLVGSHGNSELLERIRNKKKPGRKASSGKFCNIFRQNKYFIEVFIRFDLFHFHEIFLFVFL